MLSILEKSSPFHEIVRITMKIGKYFILNFPTAEYYLPAFKIIYQFSYHRVDGRLDRTSKDACRPCDCDIEGSLDDVCAKDETQITGKLKPGDCRCRHGFGGPRCDRCALGFRNYPVCDPCPCNRAGSANFETCDNKCICKENVEGEFCDTCKPGHFSLEESNPSGCMKCFCFGLSEDCSGVAWGKVQTRDLSGWSLTNLDLTRDFNLSNTTGKSLSVNVRDVPDNGFSYFKAPIVYLGNKLTSYGLVVSYSIYYVTDGPGIATKVPDLILKNNDTVIEHHSNRFLTAKENISVQIRLHESSNWFDRRTRLPATRELFMNVLSNVEVLAVRFSFHQAQVQSNVYGFIFEGAAENSTLQDLVYSVEKCSCPATFTGLSCEKCFAGHRRVNNLLYGGTCQACSCHGHSNSCDPYNGHCIGCDHNTTGPNCELCATGFYGNPSLGADLGKCIPCACPLIEKSNNFSPTCTLISTSKDSDCD
uniref:Uncharacterized protein n=1 Tax=Romanomermis culicivorax TaxID=13658 RepID=A0A915K5H3_ROMCU